MSSGRQWAADNEEEKEYLERVKRGEYKDYLKKYREIMNPKNKPSKILKHRPKKKVTLVRWLNIYPDCNYTPALMSNYTPAYKSKKDADSCALPDRIACVKVTGEYEKEK